MYLLGLKLALQHLAQRKVARTFMLFSMAALLLLGGYLYILHQSIQRALDYLYYQRTATVFLDRSLSDDRTNEVFNAIRTTPGIKEATYTDRKEFIKKYRQVMPVAAQFTDQNDWEAVPRYVLIKVAPSQITGLEQSLKKITGVESVEWSLQRHQNVQSVLNGFKGMVVVLLSAVALALGSVLMNHYKAATKNADQIKQAFLGLGASRTKLILPFLVEGSIEGACAGAIASGVFVLSAHFFQEHINDLARSMGFISAQIHVIPVALALLVMGLFFGAVGSLWLSTKKQR